MEIRAEAVLDYRTMKALFRESMFGNGRMKRNIIWLVCFALILPFWRNIIFVGKLSPMLMGVLGKQYIIRQ